MAAYRVKRWSNGLEALRRGEEYIRVLGTGPSAPGYEEFCDELGRSPECRVLNLSKMRLSGEKEIEILSSALRKNTKLEKLFLRKVRLSGPGLCHIGSSLTVNQSLYALHLSGNLLSLPAVEEFFEFLSHNSSLQVLLLDGSLISSSSADCVGNFLRKNSTLWKLGISRNTLQDYGAIEIAAALSNNTSIRDINLQRNSIEAKGAFEIAKMLQINSTMTKLLLGKNLISSKGGIEIAQALKGNHTLEKLDLSSNGLGPEAAAAIASMLMVNKTITTLDVGVNPLKGSGVAEIAKALRVNSTLHALHLGKTQAGLIGAASIAEALKMNNSLTFLRIVSNNIQLSGAIYIAGALSMNTTLRELQMGDNVSGPEGDIELLNSIKSNPNSGLIAFGGPRLTREYVSGKKQDEAFFKIIKSNETCTWNRLRLMVVGQGKAGKSATVRSLLGKPFLDSWDSTIGAEISEGLLTKNAWRKNKRQGNYAAELAAKILLEKFSRQRSTVTTKSSNVAVGRKENKSNIPTPSDAPHKSPIGNLLSKEEYLSKKKKAELLVKAENLHKHESSFDDRQETKRGKAKRDAYEPSTNELRQFKKKLTFYNAKDTEQLVLSLWDFGGQEVFYAMHHIFLTETGVYIVVFDMRELLDISTRERARKFLLFWLRSIRLHAPTAPLLLVGTFMMDAQEEINGVDKLLREIVKGDFSQIILADEHVYFPVDNKERIGIERLRKCIEVAVKKDKSIQKQVPVRWMEFLDRILARSEQKAYLTLSKGVSEIGADLGLHKSEQELSLSLFHERGFIVHVTATEILKEVVVIKPQWLISTLGKLIRDTSLHVDFEKYDSAGFRQDAERAFQTGIVSKDFLEYLWEGDQTDFLIDLMKRTMLLSEWKRGTDFLIPSLLPGKKMRTENDIEQYVCVFDFSKSFLPNGVFQRIVCLSVEYMNRSELEIDEIPLSKHAAVLNMCTDTVVHISEDLKAQSIRICIDNAEFCHKVVSIISSMIEKINYDVMNGNMKYTTLFVNPKTSGFVSVESATKSKMFPFFHSKVKPKRVAEANASVNLEEFLGGI